MITFNLCFANSTLDHTNVEPGLNQNVYNEELYSEFMDSELHMAVFTQKNNKCPGIDNIPCEIIKQHTALYLHFYQNYTIEYTAQVNIHTPGETG